MLLNCTELSLALLLMSLLQNRNDKMRQLNIDGYRLLGMIFKSFFHLWQVCAIWLLVDLAAKSSMLNGSSKTDGSAVTNRC